MIYLDDHADTFPVGLHGTPFEQVYIAVRSVAAQVWATDPEIYRAGMAWGWYATHKPDALVAFRDVVVSALISAQAPMIKATQTNAELVEYLRQWRGYRPTFPQLQSLYSLFGAVVDVQPISDPESQAVLPVDNTRLAFYLRVESVDPERPLSLSDAITIAERATPMGSRPYAYRVQESRITVPVALAPAGVTVWVENDTVASDPPPLPVYGIPMGGMISPTGHSTYYVQELPEQIIVDNIGLYGMIGPMVGMMTEYVPLPTVSYADFGGTSWLRVATVGSYVDVAPNDQTSNLTPNNVDYPEYDSTKSYGIVQWQKISGTIAGRVEFAIVESSGKFQAKNVTSNTLSFYQARIAVCSSSDATVITVYDSSNNPYNAFKYTLNGTDYYYVLDGTQTDWTDDLESIGYRLWNLKVYGQYGNEFTLTLEYNFMFVETGGTYSMLEGGTASTTWEIFGIYDSNGNELSHESDFIDWINASNIYYTASPTRPVSVAYALLIVKPPIS